MEKSMVLRNELASGIVLVMGYLVGKLSLRNVSMRPAKEIKQKMTKSITVADAHRSRNN